MDLHGSWALITGAAGGLGSALAKELASRGANLVLTDLDPALLERQAATLRDAGRTVRCERLDVTDLEAWRALAATLQAAGQTPRVLVNNAGVAAIGSVLDLSDAAWKQVIDVDLWGVVYGCRTFVPLLRDLPGPAAVLNVSSASCYVGLPMAAPYFIAKAGVLRLTQTLSAELDPADVSFTALCPGSVATGIAGQSIALGSADGQVADAVYRLLTPPHRSAEVVAKRAIDGLLRRRAVVNVFWEAWLLNAAARLLPQGWIAPLGRRYLQGRVQAGAFRPRASV